MFRGLASSRGPQASGNFQTRKNHGLNRIATLGLPLDLALMTLAGTEKGPAKTAHKVLRETSVGFLRDGTLFRLAGVIIAV